MKNRRKQKWKEGKNKEREIEYAAYIDNSDVSTFSHDIIEKAISLHLDQKDIHYAGAELERKVVNHQLDKVEIGAEK